MSLDDHDIDLNEVMSRQATINIGTIGHVAHGKSTVVKAMSGVRTTKFKKEAIMNITIHLGYANAKIFKCEQCEAPKCYQAFSSSQADETKCDHCQSLMTLVRHVSFLDCPGHDVLMATMLNGAAIMDAALLLIAANETFPQPQTLEHLSVVEIMKLPIIALQNKIDLVQRDAALDQYASIRNFLQTSTIFVNAPILPIAAQLQYNIDVVLHEICKLPQPRKPLHVPLRFLVIRSFDINAPGVSCDDLAGGVLGGTVEQGVIRVGDELEVRPGRIQYKQVPASSDPQQQIGGNLVEYTLSVPTYKPLFTKVSTLHTEARSLPYAIAGGLVAVGTTMDPSLTKHNLQCGAMVGLRGQLPDVYVVLEVQVFLLTHVVGKARSSPTTTSSGSNGGCPANSSSSRFLPGTLRDRVAKITVGEMLQINCRALTTAALVEAKRSELVRLRLQSPACCVEGNYITISRMIERKHRLIGWGTVRRGIPADSAI